MHMSSPVFLVMFTIICHWFNFEFLENDFISFMIPYPAVLLVNPIVRAIILLLSHFLAVRVESMVDKVTQRYPSARCRSTSAVYSSIGRGHSVI
jgi:hypothetical protein